MYFLAKNSDRNIIQIVEVIKEIVDFVEKHRISVLTTLLPNGKPHSGTMHYASSSNPLSFIFLTERKARKCKHFEEGKRYGGSLVIGFSEEEWVEFQMEGEVYLIEDQKELEEAWKIYANKFVGADKYKVSHEDVLLKFVPKWWRYTEFRPKPSKIISSDKK